MIKWEIKLEIEVSDNWIADGFNMSDTWRLDMLNEHIREDHLGWAYLNEINVKSTIISEPSKEEIEEAINRYEEED